MNGATMSLFRERRLLPPDFGPVIRRERQCLALLRLMPRLTFICAPGGYGKSVLASQFADSDVFGQVVWIRFSNEVMRPNDLERAVVAAISAAKAPDSTSTGEHLADEAPELPQLWLDSADNEVTRVCLVFDGLRLVGDMDYSSSIGHLMNSQHPLTHVVVTTRDSQPPDALSHLCTLLETPDLTLESAESTRLVRMIVDDPSLDETEELHTSASGQAALLSVLARVRSMRQPSDHRAKAVSSSVSALLGHLSETQLSEEQRRQLLVVAMLGHGTDGDVALVCGCQRSAVDLAKLGETLPLIRVSSDGDSRFDAHDLARQCFASKPNLISAEPAVVRRACDLLAARGEAHHALGLSQRAGDMVCLADLAERFGVEIVEHGRQGALTSALDYIGPEQVVGRPGLLMARAHACWASSQLDDARQCVSLALQLAEHSSDDQGVAAAFFLRARLRVPCGDFDGVRDDMETALREPRMLTAKDQAVARAYAGLSAGFAGDAPGAFRHFSLAEEIASRVGPSDSAARIKILKGVFLAMVVGDQVNAFAEFSQPDTGNSPPSIRLLAVGNAGVTALELGRVRTAEDYTHESLVLGESMGMESSVWGDLSTLAGIEVTSGKSDVLSDFNKSLTARILSVGDVQAASINAAYTSVLARSLGDHNEALRQVESVIPLMTPKLGPVLLSLVHLERAASLLALDDLAQATREAQRVHDEVAPMGAMYLHLKADMILAEVDCRIGNSASAVERIGEHVDYILTESPNWMIAMYVRAFPRLLGVVAKAVGVAELPSHMVSMILPAYAEPAIAAASGVLDPRPLAALSQRLLGRRGSGRRVSDLPRENVCRVQLFGGLEVVTQDGPVPSKAWRKRKARLLFAMLAVRRGGDVPTDQILDYLWPEFSEDKALNNLYVVWSAMKHALSPNLPRGEPCPYVERAGTVCHLIRSNVVTDLDAFEDKLVEGKQADHEGDAPKAIAAYREVMATYRGELLPGDIYDDWFRSARDRCKHEYSDAALRLAALLQSGGDVPEAVQVIRQALVHDPWREDLYQSVLRHQISEGQRSAAIETYLSCRDRLTDDLGIDPSAETTKLYQHVLAMETPDDEDAWSLSGRRSEESELFLQDAQNRTVW